MNEEKRLHWYFKSQIYQKLMALPVVRHHVSHFGHSSKFAILIFTYVTNVQAKLKLRNQFN